MYSIHDGVTSIGSSADAEIKQDIVLTGAGVEPEHCLFESVDGVVTLHPIGSLCCVNRSDVRDSVELIHGSIVQLGEDNLFRLVVFKAGLNVFLDSYLT
jgi:pSer/pThr/pTyr-binding forkhead associated (FHA) protein